MLARQQTFFWRQPARSAFRHRQRDAYPLSSSTENRRTTPRPSGSEDRTGPELLKSCLTVYYNTIERADNMVKSHASRGKLLTVNLPQLQNLIKVSASLVFPSVAASRRRIRVDTQRDPKGYHEEFLNQYNHYTSLLRLHSLAPSSSTNTSGSEKASEKFCELVNFISQVAQCYPEDTKSLPGELRAMLLGTDGAAVKGDLRRTVLKNLVMLRNKEVIDSIECAFPS